MRIISGFLLLVFLTFAGYGCFAQTDSALHAPIAVPHYHYLHKPDTLAQKETALSSTYAMRVLRYPDPHRPNQFIDSVIKAYALGSYYFGSKHQNKSVAGTGRLRHTRDMWPLWVIIGLIVYFGVLNKVIRNDIYIIITTFYNQRSLVKSSREDSFLNSWAFIFLFILFAFTIGMFIYFVTKFYGVQYQLSGISLFLVFSAAVVVLFIFKVLSIRFLGFVFDIKRHLRDYLSVLYLTYFNIAFVFLPVVICFSLITEAFMPQLIIAALVMAGLIFVIQYARAALKIISNIRFQKIYLIIYLCALEICPILILIKALEL